MAGTLGGCVNHPGIEAVVRCRQCGKALCKTCVVPGQTGTFCSVPCRDKHQAFVNEARDTEVRKGGGGNTLLRLRKFLGGLIVFVAVVVALLVVASFVEIPVLSGLARTARGIIGF